MLLPGCKQERASRSRQGLAQHASKQAAPLRHCAARMCRTQGRPPPGCAPPPQSELAFRLLCRRHGATGAYTPMLHARLSLEAPDYLAEHFSTCEQDRWAGGGTGAVGCCGAVARLLCSI